MALVKTVELKILANAGDAQRQLDEVSAEADKLDGNAIRMRFRVDGAEGKAQLDAIKARAGEMGFKDVSIKVKVDGAGRAIADLMAVKHEEDQVRDAGLMNRIGGMVGAAGGGIPGSIGGIGSLPLPALAAAIPLIGALATELAGVVAGFAAAGTGAGAFALLAMPAVDKVKTAYQGLHAAQAKFAAAQAKEAADPTKAHANAVSAAALNLKLAQESISKMPASEQAAIKGIGGLAAEFGKLSRAFQPQAFSVFAAGLKVINGLLPHLAPFANTFAQGLDKLLAQAGKFTQSKGFSDWLKQFHSLEGPAIASIGHGIGEVANSFGKLMTVMSGKDVGHAINIAFGAISGTINAVTFAIRRFMQNWDGMSAAAAKGGHAVAGAFKTIGQGAVQFQNAVDHAFLGVIHGAEHMVSGVVHAVSSLAGKIKGAFAGAAGWLLQAGKNIVEGLIRGIESMAGAVGSAIGHIASTIRSFLPFSPAKQGPLSGQGSPDIAGAKIAAMLAGGMDTGMPGVLRAAGRLAGAAGALAVPAGVSLAYAGHRGSGDTHIHVNFNGVVGDKYAVARQIHQVMRDYKRGIGGGGLGLA